MMIVDSCDARGTTALRMAANTPLQSRKRLMRGMPSASNSVSHVRVVVRVKPDSDARADAACVSVLPAVESSSRTARDAVQARVTLTDSRYTVPEVVHFAFPAAYAPSTTQDQLHSAEVQPLVDATLRGNSSCLFAYGATGTGKTYTLQGTTEQPGLVPRLCAALTGSTEVECISCSSVEVYNERLYDLLASSDDSPRVPMKMLETSDGCLQLPGITNVDVHTHEEFMAAYARSCARRCTGSTSLNATSSRSHALMILTVRRVQ